MCANLGTIMDYTKIENFNAFMEMQVQVRVELDLAYDFDDLTDNYWAVDDAGTIHWWDEMPDDDQLGGGLYTTEDGRDIRRVGDFAIQYGSNGCGDSYDFIFAIAKELKIDFDEEVFIV
jgi:hypothetical protein